ncbi:MAG TPA: ATPase P [Casimicrobiaceae bacterium]
MIEIAIPGRATLRLATALIDFNGTLALDGRLIDGVAARLRALAACIDLHVITGDTTGTARQELSGLPVQLQVMPAEGQTAAKRTAIERLGAGEAVAIGNGSNDRGLFEKAALSIVVVGGEGCATQTLLQADVACSSIGDALDLLLTPRRLVATLRR